MLPTGSERKSVSVKQVKLPEDFRSSDTAGAECAGFLHVRYCGGETGNGLPIPTPGFADRASRLFGCISGQAQTSRNLAQGDRLNCICAKDGHPVACRSMEDPSLIPCSQMLGGDKLTALNAPTTHVN